MVSQQQQECELQAPDRLRAVSNWITKYGNREPVYLNDCIVVVGTNLTSGYLVQIFSPETPSNHRQMNLSVDATGCFGERSFKDDRKKIDTILATQFLEEA